uniref:Uncharacterized protein n=1 Tax=Oryza rufipogon TaxID=4529 RepID=A0A0E0NY68_ORYRU
MVPPMHTEAGSSQFQGAFSGVPQVNMPVFSTGMNDQWQGAPTYNTSLHLQGMYQMSINENTPPQGPSFLEIEPYSYGGGSSTAQHEIGPSQLDESPPVTQRPKTTATLISAVLRWSVGLSASDIHLKDYLCQDAGLQPALVE